MYDDCSSEIREQLNTLRLEHRDLDIAISHLTDNPVIDQLHLRRLKKRKLYLRDAIERLESLLIPDLDA